jgi:Tol biopolymer transport system component
MSGTVVGTIGDPGESISTPVLSPSASRLAYSAADKDELHVWVLDLESGATRRITQFEGRAVACSWSADGRQLLVERTTPGNWSNPEDGLYLFDVDSGGAPKRIGDGRAGQLLPDGSGVLYWRFGMRADDALEWRSLETDAQPKPFADSMTRAFDPVLSPDGRFVAFLSDDTGTDEVWVARFPGGEQRFQISRDGGHNPQWSQDGRFLYFQDGERIYQVPVTGNDRSGVGAPRELFDGAKEKLSPRAGLAVLPDGSGFIMVQQLPLKDGALIYVQNWAAEFRQGR